jgi:hypothetical protein
VGVAFLVASDIAVTCVHVVSQAVGGEASEGAELVLDQPLAGEGRNRRHTARVQRLLPEEPGGAGDIAILRLAEVPATARAVRLVDAHDLWGHSVRTFGFPAKRDYGVWHDGLLRSRQAAGWIQADAASSTGYPIAPGFSGAPVWDNELAGVVGMVVAADTSAARAGYVIPTKSLLDAWPELRTDAILQSPYRGLLAFRDVDQKLFFGRKIQSDELADQVSGRPIVTVIGTSGCGKTSLVQAGVVPRLRARGMAVAVMRAGDGSTPVHALAAALGRLLEPERSQVELLAELPALAELIIEHGLRDVVPQVLEATDKRRLVIVLDQAEQLLEQPRDAVNAALAALFPDPPPTRLGVVLTLRADYLDTALRHAGMAGLLREGFYLLSAMTPEQIAEAVTGPIERVAGVNFERGLAERITADAGSDSGALPLLGNTLALLWQRQQAGAITHQVYEEMGKLSGSVARYAEEVWAGIPESEHDAAQRLFLALVRISRDGVRSSRCAVTQEQLGEQGWSLAQRLATTRLIVAGRDAEDRPIIELAHDALIDRWTWLRNLVDANREFRMWQEELRDDLARWQRADQVVELLLRGDPLQTARSWLAQRGYDLPPAERDFITASAREHRRSGRHRQARIAVFASVLVIALVATMLLVRNVRAGRAAEQAIATSRAFAAAARASAETDQARSVLLALAAYRESPTGEARQALFQSYLDTRGTATVLSGAQGSFVASDATRDGRLVVLLSGQDNDLHLTLWTRESGKPPRTTRFKARPTSQSVRVTNDGSTLALTGDYGIVLIDIATGKERKIYSAPDKVNLDTLSLSDDGSLAAAAVNSPDSDQHRIIAWKLQNGQVVAERSAPPGISYLSSATLAPDLHSLVVVYPVAGREDKGVERAEVWDMISGGTRVLEDRLDEMQVTSEGFLVSCTRATEQTSSFIVRKVADGTETAHATINIPHCAYGFEVDQAATTIASGGDSSVDFFDLASSRKYTATVGAKQDLSDFFVLSKIITDERGHNFALAQTFPEATGVQMVPLQANGATDTQTSINNTTKLDTMGHVVSVSDESTPAKQRRLRVRSQGGDSLAQVPLPAAAPNAPSDTVSTAMSPDGNLLAYRVSVDHIKIYSLPMLNPITEIITSTPGSKTQPGELFFNQADRLITRIGSEVTCWEPQTGKMTCHLDLLKLPQLARIEPSSRLLDDVKLSPLDDPNQLLVVDTYRSAVLTIDIPTGAVIRSLEIGDRVLAVARQHNSPYLMVNREKYGIELWDVDQHRRVLGPIPDTDRQTIAKWLPRPGRILISDEQGRVELWQVGSESPAYSLELPYGLTGADVSEDGSQLAVSKYSGPVLVVDLRPETWVTQTCHVLAGRELTREDVGGLPALSTIGPLCAP